MSVQLTLILEKGEDGFWIATIPEIPGAFSQGRTKAQARANVIEATLELMEARRDLAIQNRTASGIVEKMAFQA